MATKLPSLTSNSPLQTESTEELTPLGMKSHSKGFKFSAEAGGPSISEHFSPEDLKKAYHAAHNITPQPDGTKV